PARLCDACAEVTSAGQASSAEPVDGQPGRTLRVAAKVVSLTRTYLDQDVLVALRDAERIAAAVEHERGYAGGELALAGAVRPARRIEREGEADDRLGTEGGRRTAGDPGAARPATDHERDLRAVGEQLADDRRPRLVELGCRRRGLAAGHPVRL